MEKLLAIKKRIGGRHSVGFLDIKTSEFYTKEKPNLTDWLLKKIKFVSHWFNS